MWLFHLARLVSKIVVVVDDHFEIGRNMIPLQIKVQRQVKLFQQFAPGAGVMIGGNRLPAPGLRPFVLIELVLASGLDSVVIFQKRLCVFLLQLFGRWFGRRVVFIEPLA